MSGFFRPGDFQDYDDDREDESIPQGRRVKANVRAIDREYNAAAHEIARRQGLGHAPVKTRKATPEEIERIFKDRRVA